MKDFFDCFENVDIVTHISARTLHMNDKSEYLLPEIKTTRCSGTHNLARKVAKIDGKKIRIFELYFGQ